MRLWAGIVRVSHMGSRVSGAANVHTDREQVSAIEAATPPDDRLEILPPELDVSGGLPLEKRPSLRLAVEGVEAGTYAGIIVAYQSRLFRNVEEEEAVWRRVEAAGGEVLLALDGLDTKTVSGRMVRRIKSAINTAEREEHAERFERLREWATAAGVWQRRQTPRGYSKDPNSRQLVPDENAVAVRRAFREFVAGASIRKISHSLGMTPSGARYLLKNRVYLGELQVGQHVNPKAHPPIIDEDIFAVAEDRLNSQVRSPRKHRAPALLAGIIRCQSCGHVMTRGGSKGGPTYICPGSHSGKRCPRPAAIKETRVDNYVIPIVLHELARLEIAETSDGTLVRARRKLRNAERELDAYLDAVSPDDVGADAFNRAARRKRAVVVKAQEEFQTAMVRSSTLPRLENSADIWTHLNGHERNALLRGLLHSVVVLPAGRGKRLPPGERVRVLKFGSSVTVPMRRGGEAGGIFPLPFLDHDDVRVLATPLIEDRLQDECSVS